MSGDSENARDAEEDFAGSREMAIKKALGESRDCDWRRGPNETKTRPPERARLFPWSFAPRRRVIGPFCVSSAMVAPHA